MPAKIKCKVCGKVFVGRVGQKYCGKECAGKVRRMRQRQASSTFSDRCLASAMKAVAACDEDTINRIMSIFATNKSPTMIKPSHANIPRKGRTCEVCGKTFDAKSSAQKYCSQGCVKVARKRKQLTTTDRHVTTARIAVGGLTGETRTRLAAMLEGADA